MGAWGPGPFDNDTAQDWIPTLTSRPTFAECRDALAAFDAAEWEYMIAAVEVVASAVTAPGPHLPEEVRRWLETTVERPDAADVRVALDAIDFVLISGARELWPDPSHWLALMDELRARLESVLGDRP